MKEIYFLRTFLIIVLAICAQQVGAQHIGQYSLMMYDRYGFNPGYGGMERSLAAGLHFRSQWAGIDGNPEYRVINAHLPFYLWQGGLGLQLQNESIGAESQTGFALSYNYVYESAIGLFSTGIRLGLVQKKLDGSKLRAPEGIYEGLLIDHQDAQLPNFAVSGYAPLVEAGIYYAGDYAEGGISITGWYPSGMKLDEIAYQPKPAIHLFGEYILAPWDQVSLFPGLYIKSDGIQTQAEVYIRGEWEQLVTGSLGYRGFGNRNLDAIILAGGVRLSPRFFLHYAYDIGLSPLRTAHQGTHEVMIRYNLGKIIGAGLPPRIIYNPRNL